MLHSLLAAHAAALIAVGSPSPAVAPDSAAEAAIVAEVRAFYRDLDAHNWAPMLDHFIPAKVTARWAPPAASGAWAGLTTPAPVGRGDADGAPGQCAARVAVAVVGDWARVRARRCADPPDELWLLRVSGRWKIVHLELAAPRSVAALRSSRAVSGPLPDTGQRALTGPVAHRRLPPH